MIPNYLPNPSCKLSFILFSHKFSLNFFFELLTSIYPKYSKYLKTSLYPIEIELIHGHWFNVFSYQWTNLYFYSIAAEKKGNQMISKKFFVHSIADGITCHTSKKSLIRNYYYKSPKRCFLAVPIIFLWSWSVILFIIITVSYL